MRQALSSFHHNQNHQTFHLDPWILPCRKPTQQLLQPYPWNIHHLPSLQFVHQQIRLPRTPLTTRMVPTLGSLTPCPIQPGPSPLFTLAAANGGKKERLLPTLLPTPIRPFVRHLHQTRLLILARRFSSPQRPGEPSHRTSQGKECLSPSNHGRTRKIANLRPTRLTPSLDRRGRRSAQD